MTLTAKAQVIERDFQLARGRANYATFPEFARRYVKHNKDGVGKEFDRFGGRRRGQGRREKGGGTQRNGTTGSIGEKKEKSHGQHLQPSLGHRATPRSNQRGNWKEKQSESSLFALDRMEHRDMGATDAIGCIRQMADSILQTGESW